MNTFLDVYWNCELVVVMKGGKAFGIPCAFVLFEDGVAWADDAVLQDMPSTHPYHQLYGEVIFDGPDAFCQGHRFMLAPVHVQEVSSAWNSIERLVGERIDLAPVHDNHEWELRRDRLRMTICR